MARSSCSLLGWAVTACEADEQNRRRRLPVRLTCAHSYGLRLRWSDSTDAIRRVAGEHEWDANPVESAHGVCRWAALSFHLVSGGRACEGVRPVTQ